MASNSKVFGRVLSTAPCLDSFGLCLSHWPFDESRALDRGPPGPYFTQELFVKFFDLPPSAVLEIPGRMFPVEIEHIPQKEGMRVPRS